MDRNSKSRAVSPLPSPVRRPLGLLAVENSLHGPFSLPSPKTPSSARLLKAAATANGYPHQQQPMKKEQPPAAGTPGLCDESTIRFFPGSAFRGGGNLSEISLSFLDTRGAGVNDEMVLGGRMPAPAAGGTPISKPSERAIAQLPAPVVVETARPSARPSLAAALSIESPGPSVPLDLSQSDAQRAAPSARPATPSASLSFNPGAHQGTPSPIQHAAANESFASQAGHQLVFADSPVRKRASNQGESRPGAAPGGSETPSEHLRDQVHAWRSRYLEATATVQQLRARHDAETNALRREAEDRARELSDLQRRLGAAEGHSASVQGSAQESTEALVQMTHLVRKLEADAREGDRARAELAANARELEARLQEASAGEQRATATAESLRQQLKQLQGQQHMVIPAAPPLGSVSEARLAALQSEVGRLTEQLRSSGQRCASLEATLEAYDRALCEAMGQLDSLAEAKRSLEEQLTTEGAREAPMCTAPDTPGKTVILSRALMRMSELHAQTREMGARIEDLTRENYHLARKHRDTLLQLRAAQQAGQLVKESGPNPEDLARLQGRLDQALADLQDERLALHRVASEKAALEARVKGLEASAAREERRKGRGGKGARDSASPSVGPSASSRSPFMMFVNPLTGEATPEPEPADASFALGGSSAAAVNDSTVSIASDRAQASTTTPHASPAVKLREELARLRVSRDEAVSRAAELAEQVDSQTRRLAHLQRLVRDQSRASDLLEEREEQLGEARRDLERVRARARELEGDLTARQREHTDALARLAEVQARVTELEFLYGGETALRGEAEGDRDALEMELRTAMEETARARQSQADALRAVGEACGRERAARGEVEAARAEVRRQEGLLEAAREAVRELEARVASLEASRGALVEEAARWRAESARAEAQVAALQGDLSSLQEALALAEARSVALSAELESAVAGREVAERSMKDAMKKKEDHEARATESEALLRDEAASLRSQLAALSSELDECYGLIGAADAEKASMEHRMASLARELDAAGELQAHLEGRTRELTAERHAAGLRAEAAEAQVQALRTTLASLEAEVGELQEALGAEGRRSSDATGTVEELTARVRAAERERETVQARLAAVLGELAVQRNTSAALQSAMGSLQEQNGRLRSQASCTAELITVLGAMADRVAQCSEDLEAVDALVAENEALTGQLEELRAAMNVPAPLAARPEQAAAETSMTPAPRAAQGVFTSDVMATPAPQTARGAARARVLLSAIREFTEAVAEVATPSAPGGKSLSDRFDEAKPATPPAAKTVESDTNTSPPGPDDMGSPSPSPRVDTLRQRMGRLNRILDGGAIASSEKDDAPSPDPANFQNDAARMSHLARTSLIHELRSQIRLLQSQLDGERIERSRMVVLLKEGLEREGEGERRVAELQRELEGTHAEMTRIRRRCDELTHKLEDSEGAVARLEAHVRSLDSAASARDDGAGERLAQAETERSLLAARLEEAQHARAQMAHEVEGVRDALRRELIRRGSSASRPGPRAASPPRPEDAQVRQRLRQDLTRVLAAEMGMACAFGGSGGDEDGGEDEGRRGRGHGTVAGSERGRSRGRSQARPPLAQPGSHTASRAASRAASLSRHASLSPVAARARDFSGFPLLAAAGGPTPHRLPSTSRAASRSHSCDTSFTVPTRAGGGGGLTPAPNGMVPADKYLRALKKAKKYKKEAEEAAHHRSTQAQGATPPSSSEDRTPARQIGLLDRLRGEVQSLRRVMEAEEGENQDRPDALRSSAQASLAARAERTRGASAPKARRPRSFPATVRTQVARLMDMIEDVAADGYWPVTPPAHPGAAPVHPVPQPRRPRGSSRTRETTLQPVPGSQQFKWMP